MVLAGNNPGQAEAGGLVRRLVSRSTEGEPGRRQDQQLDDAAGNSRRPVQGVVHRFLSTHRISSGSSQAPTGSGWVGSRHWRPVEGEGMSGFPDEVEAYYAELADQRGWQADTVRAYRASVELIRDLHRGAGARTFGARMDEYGTDWLFEAV